MTSHALIPAPARLAILGGGLLGRLLALALSGKGYSIDLYDRGGPEAEHAAAHVAAAMLDAEPGCPMVHGPAAWIDMQGRRYGYTEPGWARITPGRLLRVFADER